MRPGGSGAEGLGRRRLIACLRGGIITLLEGREISKAYGRQQVLENVSIKVRSGEVVALVGRSGSGKTTLAGILGGYLSDFQKGSLLFQGGDGRTWSSSTAGKGECRWCSRTARLPLTPT